MSWLELDTWARLPFGFWTGVFFVLGTIVGSFLNVCVHRLPLGQSVVTPPSACPQCGDRIPWFLNIPILSWLVLRGKCRGCGTKISPRYLLVEALTGALFAAVWVTRGDLEAPLGSGLAALALCLMVSGLIVATFIDFEHFIIPDSITLGGMAAGFLASAAAPAIQGATSAPNAMKASVLGIAVGGGLVYAVLRVGKLLFGRKDYSIPEGQRAVFGETDLRIGEESIPYEDIFYRDSDRVVAEATRVELPDRCFWDTRVQLTPKELKIGNETFDPTETGSMELEALAITIPREAMGFGDVKFMAAIGAFIGWEATIFSLMLSSILGSLVGVGAIVLRRQDWSARIPYGPYIAAAALVWLFGGDAWMRRFLETGSLF